MIYEEKQVDVFSYVGQDVKFVQCISADLAMGAGIAVQFNRHFNTKSKARIEYGETLIDNWDKCYPAECIAVDEVLCLITKRNYWMKPTHETMAQALMGLKKICVDQKINHIVMPKIGAGLDKLNFTKTREQIMRIFHDTDIKITVCVN